MTRFRTLAVSTVAATAAAALAIAPATTALAAGDKGPNNNTVRKLTAAVSAEGVLEHLQALQTIADANGGTRVSGSAGYDASANYAADVFRAAGYEVTVQEFDFRTFEQVGETTFSQVAPTTRDLDAIIMSYSGSGDVTAAATLPAGPGLTAPGATATTLGCNPEDFSDANAGTIVVISRGACAFGLKAANADAAGAAGVVIYNNAAGDLNGTLGDTFFGDIPVVGVTQALGQELTGLIPGLELRVAAETVRTTATTSNVLAETKGGNPNNVVMVGGHLDSVDVGPGINDNGSGAGSILEVAQQMAKVKPANKVRFALWGAEESGLVGATYYVNTLPDEELEKIALYLNFDMVASPNFVRFVYDGDDSAAVGAGPGPEGSDVIEDAFTGYFSSQGLESAPTDFSGRSDYGPFIAVGIPSGGLFTGAEGLKTAEEAAVYGGVAGESYDPCYHQACDSLVQDFSGDPEKAALYAALDAEYPLVGNVNMLALEQMSDAIAAVTLAYAYDTSAVNQVAGAPGKRKGIYKSGGSGSAGTTAGSDESGGGLHDGHDHEQLDAA